MTSPLQATTTESGRFYTLDGVQFISVTTVLGCVSKGDGLTQWAANCAADEAMPMLEAVRNGEQIPERARDIIRYAWKNQRDSAGNVGDMAHSWIECFLKTGFKPPVPPEIKGHIKQFLAWYERFDVQPIHVEATVYSKKHGYAGSCDLFAKVDGRVGCIDLKTSKNTYGSVALQCAAYSKADFIMTDDGQRFPIPKVEFCAVLHVRPRSLKFKEVMPPDLAFPHFLNQLDVKRDWLDGAYEKAIGAEITPATERL